MMKYFIYTIGLFLLFGCSAQRLVNIPTDKNIQQKTYPIDFVFLNGNPMDNHHYTIRTLNNEMYLQEKENIIYNFNNDKAKLNIPLPKRDDFNITKVAIVEYSIKEMSQEERKKLSQQNSYFSALNINKFYYFLIEVTDNTDQFEAGQYYTPVEVSKKLMSKNKKFRITIVTTKGKILKQSYEPITTEELKKIL